eukprot:scaffold640584_cov25-Prasinocladus_malaysianus.AAC.1
MEDFTLNKCWANLCIFYTILYIANDDSHISAHTAKSLKFGMWVSTCAALDAFEVSSYQKQDKSSRQVEAEETTQNSCHAAGQR